MFDENYSRIYKGVIIDYGVIKGNNIIFFIKPGQDGSLLGFDNKYYNIGKSLNEKFGYTIVCSNNPYDFKNDPLEDGMEFIAEYASRSNLQDYSVYYFGNSNGGMIGSRWGYKYPRIKRMLLINTPLFMNCHKILNGLEKFTGEKVVMIYGSLDPSMKFVGMIDLVKNEKVKYHIIEGENHNFSCGVCDFLTIPEKYLI